MIDARLVSISRDRRRVTGWVLGASQNLQYNVVAVDENREIGTSVTSNSRVVNRKAKSMWKKVFTIELSQPVVLNKFQVFVLDGDERRPVELSNSAFVNQAGESVNANEKSSEVLVNVGQMSPCKNVAVGRRGNFFLIGGSNDVLTSYRANEESESELWLDLIERRFKRITGNNIQFCQVLIPEKSSVIPEFFPYDVVVPSVRYRNLKKLVFENSKYQVFENCVFYEDFLLEDERLSAFRKVDSHFTTVGAKVLFCAIMARLGLEVEFEPVSIKQKVVTGDLANKFSEVKFFENMDYFEGLEVERNICEPDLVYSYDSPEGNKGKIRVYRNEGAPINKKVVIFGNSFFWSSGNSTGQCWWFSRVFSECHFIWDYSINYDYLDKHAADIVVTVTIERFLRMVPET